MAKLFGEELKIQADENGSSLLSQASARRGSQLSVSAAAAFDWIFCDKSIAKVYFRRSLVC
jgi:hypothetical protein